MFNKLEEIANSEKPRTPVLECGMTSASKEHLSNEFESDYMPLRINWVVQSPGSLAVSGGRVGGTNDAK